MILKIFLFFLILNTQVFSNFFIRDYSLGMHDFMVEEKTHTLGINTRVHTTYAVNNNTKHDAYFEILTEYDVHEQDPDHIPVWFRAEYNFESLIVKPDNEFTLKNIIDFNWKMNTVSSVEQYVKLGTGLAFYFSENSLTVVPKVLVGTYYLEIDDDIPKKQELVDVICLPYQIDEKKRKDILKIIKRIS